MKNKTMFENILKNFENCSDFKYYDYSLKTNEDLDIKVCYLDGITSFNEFRDIFHKQITDADFEGMNFEKALGFIGDGLFPNHFAQIVNTADECAEQILDGNIAVVSGGSAVILPSKNFERRTISESSGENIVKGAKDCFIENLRANTSLVRYRLKNPALKILEAEAGREFKTKVAIIYLSDKTDKRIVKEVEKRLKAINTTGVLSIGVIEEALTGRPYRLFPQTLFTERSDKFCSHIVEGRVGIIADGFPTALVIPVTLNMFMQAPEDFSSKAVFGTMLRILRYAGMFLALVIPAYYIAIAAFHQEMMPLKLAIAITQSKTNVPLPTALEVLFMLFAFELLLEASYRIPKSIGQAVSIVGALVVGNAAVAASLISPAVLVVIAIAAIAGFAIPNPDVYNAVRIWRIILVLLTFIGGIYALLLGLILFLNSLAKIEMFSVAYLTPYTSKAKDVLKGDSIVRMPFEKR